MYIQGLVDGAEGKIVGIEKGRNGKFYATIEWRKGKKVSRSQTTVGYLEYLMKRGGVGVLRKG